MREPAKMAGVGAAIGLGMIAGPMLGVLVGDYAGACKAALALAVANTVFVALFFKGDASGEAGESKKTDGSVDGAASLGLSLGLLLLGRALTSMAFRGMEGTFSVFLADYGYPDSKSMGRVFVVVGLVMVVCQGPLRMLLKRGSSPWTLCVVGGALMCLSLNTLAWRTLPLMLSIMLLSVAEGMLMAAVAAAVATVAGDGGHGMAQGLLSSMNAFARATSPVLTGALSDAHSLSTAYSVLGGLCGVGALLMLLSTTAGAGRKAKAA